MRLITKSLKLNSLNSVRSDAVKYAGAETPRLRHVLKAIRTIQHQVTRKTRRDWHLKHKKIYIYIAGMPWNTSLRTAHRTSIHRLQLFMLRPILKFILYLL